MALLFLFRYGRTDDGFVQESDMQAGLTQARLRIRESLDAHPELTIILDATVGPSSRLRARFVAHEGDTLKVHVNTALGLNLLIDTGAGRGPLLGRYRVASSKIAGFGKHQADLTAEAGAHSAESNSLVRAGRALASRSYSRSPL